MTPIDNPGINDDPMAAERELYLGKLREPVNYLHPADYSQNSITISVAKGAVLILKPDGRLERGPAFASDDETSMQIFDVLSRVGPSWMSALRERADKAEAKLAALSAQIHRLSDTV